MGIGCLQQAEAGPDGSHRRLLINSLDMTFAQIGSGTFRMGADPTEPDRPLDEYGGPVTIDRPFYLATHEVTNHLYRRFRPDHDSGDHGLGAKRQSLNQDAQPAVRVSWDDAAAFCQWLSRLEPERRAGRRYRLATEAEWEHAARARRGWRYPWGNHWPAKPDEANLLEEHTADGHAVAAPVGSYPPNPLGLYDMAGNVWEWCADWHAPLPRDPQTRTNPRINPRINPLGPPHGTARVVKGASWDHHSQLKHRCGSRDHLKPAGRWYDVGFRVVCEVDPNASTSNQLKTNSL